MSLNKKELKKATDFANRSLLPNIPSSNNLGSSVFVPENPYMPRFHQGGSPTPMPPGHRHQADGEHFYGDESEGMLQSMWSDWASTRRNPDGTPAADQRLHQYQAPTPAAYGLTGMFDHTYLTGDLEQDLGRINMTNKQWFDETGDDLQMEIDEETGQPVYTYNPQGPNADFIREEINRQGYIAKPYVAEQAAVEVNAKRSGKDKWRKLWTDVKAAARTAKDLGLFKNAYGEDRVPLPKDFTTESLEAFKEDVNARAKEHKRDIIRERQYKELSKKHDKGEISNTEYVSEIKNRGLEEFTPGYYEVDKQEFYDAMNQDFADKTESFKNISRFVGSPIDAGIRLLNEPGAAIESAGSTLLDVGTGIAGKGWLWGDNKNWITGDEMFSNTGAITDLLEVGAPLTSAGKAMGLSKKTMAPMYKKVYKTNLAPKKWHNATLGLNPNIAPLEQKLWNTGQRLRVNPNKFSQRGMEFVDTALDKINRLPGTIAKNADFENISAAAHVGAQAPLVQSVIENPDSELAWAGLLGNTWSVGMPFYRGYQSRKFNRANPMAGQFPEFYTLDQGLPYQGSSYRFSPRYRPEGIDTEQLRTFGTTTSKEVQDQIKLSERLATNKMYKKQFQKEFGYEPSRNELMEYSYINEAKKLPQGTYPIGSKSPITGEYNKDFEYLKSIETGDLPPEAIAASSVYQGSGWGGSFQKQGPYSEFLNRTMAPAFQSRLTKPGTFYRGSNLSHKPGTITRGGKQYSDLGWEDLEPGDVFTSERVMSSEAPFSKGIGNLGSNPAEQTKFYHFGSKGIQIDAPAGTRGFSPNTSLGQMPTEREFAFPKGTKFEVTSKPQLDYDFAYDLRDKGIVGRPNLQLRIIQRNGGPITRSMFKRF